MSTPGKRVVQSRVLDNTGNPISHHSQAINPGREVPDLAERASAHNRRVRYRHSIDDTVTLTVIIWVCADGEQTHYKRPAPEVAARYTFTGRTDNGHTDKEAGQ